MSKTRIHHALFALVVLSIAGMSCSSSSNSAREAGDAPVDRFADINDDERETVMINSAEQDNAGYTISPATFDTVIVRAVPANGDQPVLVEALLKGSFPDGCTQMYEMSQSRTDSGQAITLTMRRPTSAVCTQVVRPYRFFFELEERYPPGDFMLVVNDRPFAFVVE